MTENSRHIEIVRNLIFLKETKGVLSALRQDHVPIILLKGIALAEMVYPHIGMRSMTDIDILIKEKDLPLVSQRLLDLGCQLKPGIIPPTYIKECKISIVIELHTQIPYLQEKEIWGKLMPVIIDGENGYTLSLEQNIIYLCYHLAVCHANSDRKWLEDIHRIITHFSKDIDWNELGNKIKNYRLEAPCYYTILKTREVFQSHLPDYFLSGIKPKNSLKAKIFQKLFESPKPIPYVSRILPFLVTPRIIFSRLFTPLRFLCLRYKTQPPLVYLYYFIRPACLFFKAMHPFVRLLLILLRNVTDDKKRRYKESA